MHRLRIYIDTSVIGGCYDEEFEEESRALIRMAQKGNIQLLVSETLIDELRLAPENVQNVLAELPDESIEPLVPTDEAIELREAYMKDGVVGENQRNDAFHVALATIARADMILSWNFRHIVHFERIRGFNAVNLREGYLPIEIRSPKEVV